MPLQYPPISLNVDTQNYAKESIEEKDKKKEKNIAEQLAQALDPQGVVKQDNVYSDHLPRSFNINNRMVATFNIAVSGPLQLQDLHSENLNYREDKFALSRYHRMAKLIKQLSEQHDVIHLQETHPDFFEKSWGIKLPSEAKIGELNSVDFPNGHDLAGWAIASCDDVSTLYKKDIGLSFQKKILADRKIGDNETLFLRALILADETNKQDIVNIYAAHTESLLAARQKATEMSKQYQSDHKKMVVIGDFNARYFPQHEKFMHLGTNTNLHEQSITNFDCTDAAIEIVNGEEKPRQFQGQVLNPINPKIVNKPHRPVLYYDVVNADSEFAPLAFEHQRDEKQLGRLKQYAQSKMAIKDKEFQSKKLHFQANIFNVLRIRVNESKDIYNEYDDPKFIRLKEILSGQYKSMLYLSIAKKMDKLLYNEILGNLESLHGNLTDESEKVLKDKLRQYIKGMKEIIKTSENYPILIHFMANIHDVIVSPRPEVINEFKKSYDSIANKYRQLKITSSVILIGLGVVAIAAAIAVAIASIGMALAISGVLGATGTGCILSGLAIYASATCIESEHQYILDHQEEIAASNPAVPKLRLK